MHRGDCGDTHILDFSCDCTCRSLALCNSSLPCAEGKETTVQQLARVMKMPQLELCVLMVAQDLQGPSTTTLGAGWQQANPPGLAHMHVFPVISGLFSTQEIMPELPIPID